MLEEVEGKSLRGTQKFDEGSKSIRNRSSVQAYNPNFQYPQPHCILEEKS